MWVKSTSGTKNGKYKQFKPGVCLNHVRTAKMDPNEVRGCVEGPKSRNTLGNEEAKMRLHQALSAIVKIYSLTLSSYVIHI